MNSDIKVVEAKTRRDLKAFVRFPWRIYRGDPNWVPPLISDRLSYMESMRNSDHGDVDVCFFLARRDGEILGTIACVVDRRAMQKSQDGEKPGTFGFFEVVNDYAVAKSLLDAARAWAKAHGANLLRGPYNLTDWECPGVLVDGADCPPVMLAAHTPPYYKTFLEQYGMTKFHDLYAWRVFRHQIGENLEHVPEVLLRAAQMAQEQNVLVRKLRMDRWDEEITITCHLFNTTLSFLPEHVPTPLEEFRRVADQLKPILDPDLALFAEVDGKVVGFCISWPDVNRALIHLNGRLFPFGWLCLWWYLRRIDVVTFKLVGVLPEYRYRGIESLLFVESIRAMMAKRYQWLDGSLTSENNPIVNQLVARFGAERYKHYRLFQIAV